MDIIVQFVTIITILFPVPEPPTIAYKYLTIDNKKIQLAIR